MSGLVAAEELAALGAPGFFASTLIVTVPEICSLWQRGLLLTSRSGRVAEGGDLRAESTRTVVRCRLSESHASIFGAFSGQKRLDEQLRKLQALPGLRLASRFSLARAAYRFDHVDILAQ